MEETADATLTSDDGDGMKEASHAGVCRFAVVNPRKSKQLHGKETGEKRTYSVVLILSNGVTASNDSVTPAPKPAMTVRGPDILPSASDSKALY